VPTEPDPLPREANQPLEFGLLFGKFDTTYGTPTLAPRSEAMMTFRGAMSKSGQPRIAPFQRKGQDKACGARIIIVIGDLVRWELAPGEKCVKENSL
jgi:hypothetical protein